MSVATHAGRPSLRFNADSGRCRHCHSCTAHCPMSLPVEEMVQAEDMENPECILCGTCVDGCRKGAIRYEFQGVAETLIGGRSSMFLDRRKPPGYP